MTVGCTFSHAAAHGFLLQNSFLFIFTMPVKGIWQVRCTTEFGHNPPCPTLTSCTSRRSRDKIRAKRKHALQSAAAAVLAGLALTCAGLLAHAYHSPSQAVPGTQDSGAASSSAVGPSAAAAPAVPAKSFIKFWQGIVVKKELPDPLQHYAAAALLACCSSYDAERSISLLNHIVTALRDRMSWKSIRIHLIGAATLTDRSTWSYPPPPPVSNE